MNLKRCLFLILFLLFLNGCVLNFEYTPEEEKFVLVEDKVLTVESKILDSAAEEDSISSKIDNPREVVKVIKNESKKECDDINELSMKTQCEDKVAFNNAIENRDYLICETIATKTLRESCLLSVDSALILYSKNIKECDVLVEGEREQCRNNFFLKMAVNKSDRILCLNITDEALANSCNSSIADNDPCGSIDSNFMKQVCRDHMYYDEAISSSDILKCNLIIDSTVKDNCLSHFAIIGDDDPCLLKSDYVKCKDNQYFNEAIAEKDFKKCNFISDDNLEKVCLNMI